MLSKLFGNFELLLEFLAISNASQLFLTNSQPDDERSKEEEEKEDEDEEIETHTDKRTKLDDRLCKQTSLRNSSLLLSVMLYLQPTN